MNLYEWEGKKIFAKYGIAIPKGVVVRRDDDIGKAYRGLGLKEVYVKAQILSGKRGKNNGIFFCESEFEVIEAVKGLFETQIRGQQVASVLIEEKLIIKNENYLSITYDTSKKQPVLIFSESGGMDIEDVEEKKIQKFWLDVRNEEINTDIPFAKELWKCFLAEDARVVEINPLVVTKDGKMVAADAKIALDDDAFYRHDDWKNFEPRIMLGRPLTERELAARKIDEG